MRQVRRRTRAAKRLCRQLAPKISGVPFNRESTCGPGCFDHLKRCVPSLHTTNDREGFWPNRRRCACGAFHVWVKS